MAGAIPLTSQRTNSIEEPTLEYKDNIGIEDRGTLSSEISASPGMVA